MNRNMLRQAQQLQAKLAKVQEELDNTVVEGTAGGGVVKITITGKLRIQSVKINPEAVDEIDMLEDLVMVATNEAIDKAQKMAQDSLNSITGVINIPGIT